MKRVMVSLSVLMLLALIAGNAIAQPAPPPAEMQEPDEFGWEQPMDPGWIQGTGPGWEDEQGMMQPGMMHPGMMGQGMMQPGMMHPGMMGQGMMQPGMMQPGMMGQGMMPGMQPGMMGQGMMPGMQPGMMGQGMMGQGMQPGMMCPMMNQGMGQGMMCPMMNQGMGQGMMCPMMNQGMGQGMMGRGRMQGQGLRQGRQGQLADLAQLLGKVEITPETERIWTRLGELQQKQHSLTWDLMVLRKAETPDKATIAAKQKELKENQQQLTAARKELAKYVVESNRREARAAQTGTDKSAQARPAKPHVSKPQANN